MIGRVVVAGLGRLPLFHSSARAVRLRRGPAISAYIGANGGFKSFSAAMDTAPTLQGVPWFCANPDHFHTGQGVTSGVRTVLSTMRFTLPDGTDHPLWRPLTDGYASILRAEHCDLILDEVGGAAASTSGADDLPLAVKASLQELRRRDVLCRWTAPSWNRATKTLRECTQAVHLCMGFVPERTRLAVTFDGPHGVHRFDGLDVVEGWCEIERTHTHDAGREWQSKRLGFVRSYEAATFDEWSAGKRERLKPFARQVFWRPGHPVETLYDTFAGVEKLGQVTDSGTCIDCGGHRPRPKCECESPTVRRRRVRSLSASDKPAEPPVSVPG